MKDGQDFADLVEDITYKPEWEWYIGVMGDGYYLQLQWDDEDNFNPGKPYRSHGRKWYLSPHMTDSEVVLTAWAAVEFAEIHEARERFKFQGACVFNPHVDIKALQAVSEMTEVRG